MEDHQPMESLLKLTEELALVQKEERKQQLILYINELLLHDFNKLVQLLYRVDVNEQKLKELLQQNPQTDAAILIAELLVKRQQEKIKTRESFKTDDRTTEEEKW